MTAEELGPVGGDALIVVDVQNDFLPGGALAVPGGDEVVPAMNRYIGLFRSRNLPVFFTRDWHPKEHCSFVAQGGTWPPHCVQNTAGAEFSPLLDRSDGARIISKAVDPGKDSYSGFDGTDMKDLLEEKGVKRVFVGGLATDYCVLNTVLDGLKLGFTVVLLADAVRAVDVNPGDGQKALDEMTAAGAVSARYRDITSGN